MKAVRSKIIVASTNPLIGTQICTWLVQDGYAVFECKDPYKTLRLARQVIPELIVLDAEMRGADINQMIHIIETDQLSKVILIADAVNDDLKHLLSQTELNRYVKKPLERKQMIGTITSALSTINDHKRQLAIDVRHHGQLDKAEIIDEAKQILMEKWHLSENQAYIFMRKKSMDQSVRLEAVARAVLKKYGNMR